jgi:hypothetical protein
MASAPANDLALPSVVTMTTTGLHIPAGISRDDWIEVGTSLGQIDRRIQWMVGDWINAGEREGYIDSDTYDAAERLFPQLNRKTLREYASVARNSSIRMDDLSFGHHQAVVALPPEEQAEVLEKARYDELSVSQLRQEIKQETAGEEEVQCCPTCGHKLAKGVQVRTPRRRNGN